jgi:hypothetical protein
MLELNVRSLITLYIQPQGNKKNDLSQKHRQCNQRDQLLKFLMGKKTWVQLANLDFIKDHP